MKTAILFLTLILMLSLVPSLVAQTTGTNCSTITYQIIDVSVPSLAGCTGPWGYVPGGYAYDQTMTLHVDGFQTQTGAIYASANLPLGQVGHCWVTATGGVWNCRPLYTYTKTTPPTATGTNYDMINFQSLDGVQVRVGTGVGCGIQYGATKFWQCHTVACKSGTSPIVIDLSGKGFHLTDAQDGVSFDIKGDGHPIQMGWTGRKAANAFLALPGPDGIVHNGQQLFGNWTPQPPSANPNGFEALRVYDSNHDGIIDAKDPIFQKLRLWVDENHDGISQAEELHTLGEMGVVSISLRYHLDSWRDEWGNQFRYRAKVNDNTKDKSVFDIFFVTE